MPNDMTWVCGETQEEFEMFREAPPSDSGNPTHGFAVPTELWERYSDARDEFETLNDELHARFGDLYRAWVEGRRTKQRAALVDELTREGWTVTPPTEADNA